MTTTHTAPRPIVSPNLMGNRRRRKDMLFVMTLIATAMEVVNDKSFANLVVAGPFQYLTQLSAQHMAAVPDQKERLKEQRKVQTVVGALLPNSYTKWSKQLQLWFAVQLVYRLVASGWRPDRDPTQMAFVQSIYNLYNGFPPMKDTPHKAITDALPILPEALRSMDMFR